MIKPSLALFVVLSAISLSALSVYDYRVLGYKDQMLESEHGTLKGECHSYSTSFPLDSVIIELYLEGVLLDQVNVNKEGGYLFERIIPGDYSLKTRYRNRLIEVNGIRVGKSKITFQDFDLFTFMLSELQYKKYKCAAWKRRKRLRKKWASDRQ